MKYYAIQVDKLGSDLVKGDHAPAGAIGDQSVIDRLLELGAIQEVEVSDDSETSTVTTLEAEIDAPGLDLSTLSIDDLRTMAENLGLSDLPKTRAGLLAAIEKAKADAVAAQAGS